MNKCTNCGNDFEGKFCPFCGTKRKEELLCPNCGAKAVDGAHFCNECGSPLISTDENTEIASQPHVIAETIPQVIEKPIKAKKPPMQPKGKVNFFNEKTSSKIYFYLKYVPICLFALFSVLLFAFYAGSVAVSPSSEFMGEKIPSKSYGNVYTLYGAALEELVSVSGAMSALIIFAVFAVIFASVFAVVTFVPAIKGCKIKLFGKCVLLENLLAAVSFVFYILFLITGSVIAGEINSADGGMGVIAVGECPVLIIVFSIIFAFIFAGAFIARYFLNKFFPTVSEEETRLAEENEIRRAERVAAIPKPSQPTAPAVLQKPIKPVKPQYIKTANGILSGKQALIVMMILPLALLIFSIIAIKIFGGKKGYKSLNKLIRKGSYITAIVISVIYLVALLGASASMVVECYIYSGVIDIISLQMFFAASPLIVYALIMLILASVWYSKQKKFCLKMHGVKKPKKDTPLTEYGKSELNTVNEYFTALNNYKTTLINFKLYKQQSAVYNSQCKLYEAGVDYTKYPKPLVWLFAHKLVAVLAVAIVLVGIILAIALPPAIAPKESLGEIIGIFLNIY